MKNTEAIQELQEGLCLKGFTRTRMSNAMAIWSIAHGGAPICQECGEEGELVAVFVKESSRPA